MTDFLNRLIKRSNGQAAVLRPVVRSSYGVLPMINESASEFEETVTFEGGGQASPPHGRSTAADSHSSVSRRESADYAAAANSESHTLLVNSSAENASGEQRAARRSGRQSDGKSAASKAAPSSESSAGGKASGSGKGAASRAKAADASPAIAQNPSHTGKAVIQRKTVANAVEPASAGTRRQNVSVKTVSADIVNQMPSRNIGAKDVASNGNYQNTTSAPSQNKQEANTISRSKEATSRQRTTADAAQHMPQVQSRLSGDNVQRKAAGATIETTTLGTRQQNAFAQAEGRAVATPKSSIVRREAIYDTRLAKPLVATSDTAPAATQRNFHLVDDSRIEALRNAAASESTQNPLEIQPVKRGLPSESGLSERGLSQDLVIREREEPAESSLQQNPNGKQSTAEKVKHTPDRPIGRTADRIAFESESAPSTNIRVTIGRVEIRAVQQPERQAASPTSAPRKPAISLDAYLKSRNEEKR